MRSAWGGFRDCGFGLAVAALWLSFLLLLLLFLLLLLWLRAIRRGWRHMILSIRAAFRASRARA